jgi:two-component system, cell cycle sensor histidine kinase and response regulator CckA
MPPAGKRSTESVPQSHDAGQDLERFLSVSLDLLCIAGFDGCFKRLNPAWERTFGWTLEELSARPFLELVHPDDVERTKAVARSVAAGDVLTFENRYRCKDGSYRWILWQATPVPERQLIYAAGRDITDRKAVEQALAHDFNNLLTAIIGTTELVLLDLPATDPFRGDLGEIRKAGERAAALTRQLLAFSRKQVREPNVVQLDQVITDIDPMLRRLIGEDIDLLTVSQRDLGSVLADRTEIEQVILNLVVNAREAMPMGGKLTISTANVELDEHFTRTHPDASPGHYVMLAVSDTGCGMDAAIRARIFEPFFTTKEKGNGTGLSTVYGIVKQSGGLIWVYSEPGRGSTFKVYLPRAVGAPAAAARVARVSGSVHGTETVLVVEDGDGIRQLVGRALKRYGYTVLECRNPGEALLTCGRYDGPIHLVITDVIMPQMGGRELAERVTFLRPEAKVLYMSGYTDAAIADHLQKPFTVDGLVGRVREVLDAP